MIKTVLVPATGEETDLPVFGAALAVARQFGAHIDALHVRFDPVATAIGMTSDVSVGGFMVEGFIEQLERDAHEREASAKNLFDGFCAREGLAMLSTPPGTPDDSPSAQWHVETGDVAPLVVSHGMAADLVVAGRGDDGNGRAVCEAALLETGRPLLIPGSREALSLFGGTVAIAWKPTPQAARAVAAAMPFIAGAERVIVMTVDEGQSSQDADRLVRHLAWHGVRARHEHLNPEGGGAAEALLAAAGERAGLLVMGGYGRSRIREWVFGGFTQRALAEAPLPILMAH